MLKDIIFWGATGQSKVLREFINALGYHLIALFDNNPEISSPFPDVPLYYKLEGFQRWQEESVLSEVNSLVAIGGARGRDRLGLQRFLESQHYTAIVAVHPTAFVANTASIAKGSQILAKAAICAEAVIGEACIINTAASVDHETILGNGVHIAPGATLAGCVTIGDYTMIGSGAVVLPNIKIGRDVIVGAGAVVTRDVPDGKVVYGNPAKIQRDNFLSGE